MGKIQLRYEAVAFKAMVSKRQYVGAPVPPVSPAIYDLVVGDMTPCLSWQVNVYFCCEVMLLSSHVGDKNTNILTFKSCLVGCFFALLPPKSVV